MAAWSSLSGLDCGEQRLGLGVFREESWAAIKAQCHCQMAHTGRNGASLVASFPTSGYCLHGLYERLPPRQACTAWPLPRPLPFGQALVLQPRRGGFESRCQWVSTRRGETETTAEIQGLCSLGSRAEILPRGYTNCRFTSPLPAP